MVSSKFLELENYISNLYLEEKLWLLDKIVQQMRALNEDAKSGQDLPELNCDNQARPI